ncbi:TATA element modulatory factor 1 TATA binding-domain-containing protein [Polychytrium aggregatum]|uniref:TATA element modulatory factor 1 TATA binding-domain-containing protein n=1 Tax=Polychytrium aggregatum TaxID=110093 RepID=UPI0022FE365D|nr:TATA element modulatory factor 1 TATA binding-domain-containing protein [Polychytrium aggregatum]KAI9204244.1 TATA element modulatory factor 1 TATA binding-domain-containing protein [Polychytrium aggregatum]
MNNWLSNIASQSQDAGSWIKNTIMTVESNFDKVLEIRPATVDDQGKPIANATAKPRHTDPLNRIAASGPTLQPQIGSHGSTGPHDTDDFFSTMFADLDSSSPKLGSPQPRADSAAAAAAVGAAAAASGPASPAIDRARLANSPRPSLESRLKSITGGSRSAQKDRVEETAPCIQQAEHANSEELPIVQAIEPAKQTEAELAIHTESHVESPSPSKVPESVSDGFVPVVPEGDLPGGFPKPAEHFAADQAPATSNDLPHEPPPGQNSPVPTTIHEIEADPSDTQTGTDREDMAPIDAVVGASKYAARHPGDPTPSLSLSPSPEPQDTTSTGETVLEEAEALSLSKDTDLYFSCPSMPVHPNDGKHSTWASQPPRPPDETKPENVHTTAASTLETTKISEPPENCLDMDHLHQLRESLRVCEERAALAEARLAQAERERAETKKSTQNKGVSQETVDGLIKRLQEKEETIRGLLREGETLSKKELKNNNIIKKLRAKESETEKELKELIKYKTSTSVEVAEMKEKLVRMAESEKRQIDHIRNITDLNDKQHAQNIKLESDMGVLRELQADTQSALDRSWKEISELRQQNAEAVAAAQTQALEAMAHENTELEKQLAELKISSDITDQSLRREIYELRLSLSAVEEESGLREDALRHEVASLHAKLQAAEAKSEDLTFVSQEMREKPLLRQIEILQAQLAKSNSGWQEVEGSLTLRIRECEAKLNASLQAETEWSNKYEKLLASNKAIESAAKHEQAQREELEKALQSERQRLEQAEQTIGALRDEKDKLRAEHQRAMREASDDYDRKLDRLLSEERRLHEDRLLQERKRQRDRSDLKLDLNIGLTGSPVLSPAARSPRPSEYTAASSYSVKTPQGGDGAFGLGESITSGTSPAITIDKLVSALRQSQSQVSALQAQLKITTQTRDELAEELVKVTHDLDIMKRDVQKLARLETEYRSLTERYDSALEMLGEKTEKVEELEADIEDMKAAYREQLHDLLIQLEEQKRLRRL